MRKESRNAEKIFFDQIQRRNEIESKNKQKTRTHGMVSSDLSVFIHQLDSLVLKFSESNRLALSWVQKMKTVE